MTSYTLAQLEQLAATQEGRGVKDHPHLRAVKDHPLIPDLRVDIRSEIYDAVKNADGGVLTRAQIAKAVKRKKTTWLSERIEDLVRDGCLVRSESYFKNGFPLYWYSIAG